MPNPKPNPTLLDETGAALGILGLLILRPLLRPWYSRWGATDEETRRTLPGDELAPEPLDEVTRAIAIHAPAQAIWPWLAQIGQGRGGLYSYTRLENLAGCKISNADRVIPELQSIQPGDTVRLGPEGYPAFPVKAVEPDQYLLLAGIDESRKEVHTWVFYLQPVDEKNTRLIVRSRAVYPPTFGNKVMWRGITEPMHFVMERRMLKGIKARAESPAGHE